MGISVSTQVTKVNIKNFFFPKNLTFSNFYDIPRNARMIRVWLKSDLVSQQPSTCQPYGLVWNVEECFALRQDSRIVGSLIGTLSKAPHTDMCSSPMLLSAEEIDLLLSLNRISLYKFTDPYYFSEDYVNKLKNQDEEIVVVDRDSILDAQIARLKELPRN